YGPSSASAPMPAAAARPAAGAGGNPDLVKQVLEAARATDQMAAERLKLDEEIRKLGAAMADPKIDPAQWAMFNAALAKTQIAYANIQTPAERANEETERSIRLSQADARERAKLTAQFRAEDEARTEGLTGADREKRIRERVAAVIAEQSAAYRDMAQPLSLAAQGSLDLAAAWAESEAAAMRQAAANQAAAQAATQAGVDQAGLTQILLDGRAAQEAAGFAEQIAGYAQQVEGLEAVAAAQSQGAAAVQRVTQAQQVAQATATIRAAAEVTANEEVRQGLLALAEQYEALAARQAAAAKTDWLGQQLVQQREALDMGQAELSLIGATDEQRAVTLARLHAINELKRQGLVFDGTESAAARAQAEVYIRQAQDLALQGVSQQRVQAEAQEWARIWGHTAEGIQDIFAGAFRDVRSDGVDSFKDLGEQALDIMWDVAAQIAAMLIFRPVVGSALGAISPQMAAQMGYGGGGAPGMSLGPTDYLSGASQLNSLAGDPLGITKTFSNATSWLNTPVFGGGSGSAYVGADLSFEALGPTFGGLLGAGAAGFGIGMLAGSLTKDPVAGGGIGALGGAGVGFLVGGPVGALIGGLAGAGGGIMSGDQTPLDWPYTIGQVTAENGRAVVSYSSALDGGDASAMAAYAAEIAGGVNTLVGSLGGSVLAFDTSIGYSAARPGASLTEGFFGGAGGSFLGGATYEGLDDIEAAQERATLYGLETGQYQGLDPRVEDVLRNATAFDDLESLTEAADFANDWREITDAWTQGYTDWRESMRAQGADLGAALASQIGDYLRLSETIFPVEAPETITAELAALTVVSEDAAAGTVTLTDAAGATWTALAQVETGLVALGRAAESVTWFEGGEFGAGWVSTETAGAAATGWYDAATDTWSMSAPRGAMTVAGSQTYAAPDGREVVIADLSDGDTGTNYTAVREGADPLATLYDGTGAVAGAALYDAATGLYELLDASAWTVEEVVSALTETQGATVDWASATGRIFEGLGGTWELVGEDAEAGSATFADAAGNLVTAAYDAAAGTYSLADSIARWSSEAAAADATGNDLAESYLAAAAVVDRVRQGQAAAPELTPWEAQAESLAGFFATAATDLVDEVQTILDSGFAPDEWLAELAAVSGDVAALVAGWMDAGLDRAMAELAGQFDQQVGDSILAITDPIALRLAELDRQHALDRVSAEAVGGDTEAVDRLHGLQTNAAFGDLYDRLVGVTDQALSDLDEWFRLATSHAADAGQDLADLERHYGQERARILAEESEAAIDAAGRANAALGRDRRAGLLTWDADAQAEMMATMAGGGDVGLLAATQAAERARLDVSLIQADLLEAYDRQIGAIEDDTAASRDLAARMGGLADELRAAGDSFWIDPSLSPLSSQALLDEARRQFEAQAALALGGDAEAAARLVDLGRARVQAADAVWGGTDSSDFMRVQSVLDEVADQAEAQVDGVEDLLSTAEDQLSALQALRADVAAAGQKEVASVDALSAAMDAALGELAAAQYDLAARMGAASNDNGVTSTDWNALMGAIYRAEPLSQLYAPEVQSAPGVDADRFVDIVRALGYGGPVGHGEINLLRKDATWDARIADAVEMAQTAASLGLIGTVPGYAVGGPPDAGWALVGEEGPELVRFGGGEMVYPAALSSRLDDAAFGGGSGGGGSAEVARQNALLTEQNALLRRQLAVLESGFEALAERAATANALSQRAASLAEREAARPWRAG
ncbi:MAG: hypothetical protein HQL40_12615, partial [Alphaproteobacteria bacterium]|nr:hypothetical protein [Alphaproteobacteria bacterium]